MIKKKKNKIFFSILSIILVVTIAYGSQAASLASKISKKRESLIEGINQINIRTMSLHQSRMKRFEKLSMDLDEFKEEGSAKIGKENILYLTNKSGFTADELESGLKNTELTGLGKDFKKAEDTYGVNAILLMGMAKHETGNGTSLLAKEKNNLFGFNAIDSDPINAANKFETKGDSIMHVAKYLKENYLTKDGKFYNGISTDGIGSLYATDPGWSNKVQYMMIEVSDYMLDEYKKEDK